MTGDRRDSVQNDRQARENRKVAVPETQRPGERPAGTRADQPVRHETGPGPRSLPRPSSTRTPLPQSVDRLPPAPAPIWPLVDEALEILALELSPGQRAALDAQMRLMLAWNEHVNLTALRTPEQVARGHLIDSLTGVATLRSLAGATDLSSILDLGSGAGYPGLPLAVVVPAASSALVDSVGKKAAFLDVAGRAARSALEAHHEPAPTVMSLAERAEDLAQEPDHRETWDFVVARAVGTLSEVVELGLPLVKVGGHVIAWKREPVAAGLRDEINAARRVLQAAGGDHPFVVAPDRAGRVGLADHRLVVTRKVRPTPDRYPRAPAERRRSALR